MESAYEFDAPKYWMDFETVRLGVEEDDNADLWFSEHAEFEEGTFFSNPTEERSFSSNFTATGPTVKKDPRNEATARREDAAADAAAAPSKEVRKRKKPVVVKTEEVSKESSEPQPAVKLGRKRSAAIAALKTPVGKQQRVQRDSAKKAAASIHSILKTSQHKPAVALHHSISARTPDHLRRYLAKKQGQVVRTRDQVEAEEMEKMQEETRKKLRQNRKSFRRMASSSKQPTAVKFTKFTKPTTDAIGFKFRTDRRCRKRAASASRPKMKPHSSGSHPSNFPMTLRSDSTNEEFSQKKSTAVKPFVFQLDSRLPVKRDDEKEEETKKKGKGYVPTAEYLFKFETATPERFRTLSRRSLHPTCAGTHSSMPASSSGVTMPYTPKLHTLARARPTITKSAAALEEEEMARIRENPFKSQPLDPKVFNQQGLLGVPKKPHHPATSPHTPKLATRERGEARKEVGSNAGAEDEQVLFKAQLLPKGMFERVLGVPKKKAQPVTHPESPELALKRRNLHRSISEDEEEKCQSIVANPMPDFSHKFEPQLPHRKTEIEPFAFEERYKDKPTRETLVQQILRREKRQPFKANPIPDFDVHVPRPVLPHRPITEPKTPVLQTKTRGNEYESKWRQKLEEIVHKAKENTEFLAKDAAVLYKAPFTTVRTERPLLEVSNFLLHTELRKEQRSKFDAEREQKELQREQENREQQAMVEAKEAKKVASLRRSLVHKASRIRHYAPTMIAPSSKPLTAPQSPHFRIKFRELH